MLFSKMPRLAFLRGKDATGATSPVVVRSKEGPLTQVKAGARRGRQGFLFMPQAGYPKREGGKQSAVKVTAVEQLSWSGSRYSADLAAQ
jgi:hypothetical protein